MSAQKRDLLFKVKAYDTITGGICLIFRGLFFEQTAEIERKHHLRMARCDFSHPKDIFSGEFIKIHPFVMIMIDFLTQSHYTAPLRVYRRSNGPLF